jgi:hypothetical protein
VRAQRIADARLAVREPLRKIDVKAGAGLAIVILLKLQGGDRRVIDVGTLHQFAEIFYTRLPHGFGAHAF